ncbi:hypothetical protein FGG08_006334 [Glutinoglossum americanum]|uniref:Uncharacterized protein n=1 Tax=Glutinoglossum americanum TaxID=1670608 RepID=A0A9P8KXL2_9PEZI|nr:hypothetical protein FGG08_006334 [Glutinoglossum americanum]
MSQPTATDKDNRSRQGSLFQIHGIKHTSTISPTEHYRQRSPENTISLHHASLTPPKRMRGESISEQTLKASPAVSDRPSPFDAVKLLRLSLEENPNREGKDNLLNYVLSCYDYLGDNVDPRDDTDSCPFPQVLDRLDQKIPMWSS